MSKLATCLWPLCTLILLGVTLFFNYTASTGLVSDLGVGEVSDKYPLEITPGPWTFGIWAFIYIWQCLWIIYVLYLSVKYEMKHIIFGKWFYITYNFANICNALWITVWVNEHIILAAILLIGITINLIISVHISHKYMLEPMTIAANDTYGGVSNNDNEQQNAPQRAPKWLLNSNSTSIRVLIYAFVLNGIPFYATWCVIASHLNIGITLCYKAGITNKNASILMVSVLTVVIFMYWYLDFYRLRTYLQYTYSPYIVLIIAFCGVLTNGVINERPSSVFTLILLIVAIIGSIVKVIMGVSIRNKAINVATSFQNV